MSERVIIKPLNFLAAEFLICGSAPYVQNKFSEKAKQEMIQKHEAGGTGKKGALKPKKNFTKLYEAAKHISHEGWIGIPAPAFRNGMVSACRLVGFKMTHAKLSVFVDADGYDAEDETPLVRITKGKPFRHDGFVRNQTGVADIRPRPMWKDWEALVRVSFDADQFTLEDVTNLLHRVGRQVGIGEGRPDSRNSCGMGWGTFTLAEAVRQEEAA